MAKLTEQQHEAVYTSNKNIIVSAGAGSGKTSVLSKRVIRLLTEFVHIDELIVMTFTKAAATELKHRILLEVQKEIKTTKDTKLKLHLESQLNKIPSSLITTIDSFCSDVLKRFSFESNINRDFIVANSSLLKIKVKQFIKDIINENLDNPDYEELIYNYTDKNPNKLFNFIFESYEYYSNRPDYVLNVTNHKNNYATDKFFDLLLSKTNESLRLKQEELLISVNTLEKEAHISDYSLKDFDSIITILEPIIEAESIFDIEEMDKVKYKTFRPNDDNDYSVYKSCREHVKKIVEQVFKIVKYNFETHKEIILSHKYQINVLYDILLELDKRIFNFKNMRNIKTFSDISKEAIDIIRSNEHIQNYYKNTFKEILIDEFQDTSTSQDELLKLINNGNNVYIVGDLKQSIYGFREARPDIFSNYYITYKEENENSIAIDLTMNFRSSSKLLEDVNNVMTTFMDKYIGGIDYDTSQRLVYGNTSYDKAVESNTGDGIKLIRYNNFSTEKIKTNSIYGYNEQLKSYFVNDNYKEAYTTASKIKKLVDDENFLVFDMELKTERRAEYHDFAILARQTSDFNKYIKIFRELDIPLVTHLSDKLLNNAEVQVFISILNILQSLKTKNYTKYNYELSMISLLRSFLVDINDGDLELHLDTIREYGFNIEGLSNKIDLKVYSTLSNLVNILDELSLSKLTERVFTDFDFYSKLNTLNNISSVENNLFELIRISKDFEQLDFSIEDFLVYFDDLKDNKLEIEGSTPTALVPNAVNMMTIHKSKGLQFPVVFLACSYKKLTYTPNNVSKDFGLIFKSYYNDAYYDTLVKDINTFQYYLDCTSEYIRLLYVALTRAQQHIYIVSSFETKHDKPIEEILSDSLSSPKLLTSFERFKFESFNKLFIKCRWLFDNEEVVDDDFYYFDDYKKTSKKIKSYTNNSFKFNNVLVEPNLLEKKTFSNSEVIIDKNTISALNFGNHLHEYFEIIDFSKNINTQLDDIKDEYVKDKLLTFSNTELFTKELPIKSLNEYEFKYIEKSGFKNHIVNGIIDLLLEYKNKLVIVDFKTKVIDKDEYFKQVKGYMDYISNTFNRDVEGYLYSIIDGKLLKID